MNDRQKLTIIILAIIKMSDTTSLPSQDYDPSDSDLHTYVVRITPHEKFTFQQVAEYIEAEPLFYSFVVSRETVPREHFHAVIQVDQTITIEDVRGAIRAFIIPFWSEQPGKLPRGFGNKQYNLQLSSDIDKAVSYAVKLGEYVYGGFTEEYITQRKAESFEKKKPSNFKAEYIELCQRFQDSEMDIREFMLEYVRLKAKYGQQVRMSDAYGYAVSNLIKRDPDTAVEFVENYLYKQ